MGKNEFHVRCLQVGEIVVKSSLVMACYLGNQQATDKAIIELPGHGYGWYRTGVLAIDFFALVCTFGLVPVTDLNRAAVCTAL